MIPIVVAEVNVSMDEAVGVIKDTQEIGVNVSSYDF